METGVGRAGGPHRTMTTLVWYRMLASMVARPRMVSLGRRCPVKKGPMMSSTAHVAAKYLHAPSRQPIPGSRVKGQGLHGLEVRCVASAL